MAQIVCEHLLGFVLKKTLKDLNQHNATDTCIFKNLYLLLFDRQTLKNTLVEYDDVWREI